MLDAVNFWHTQQTQNICITFKQCWANVEDVGPTLYEFYTNVLCLLGIDRPLKNANYDNKTKKKLKVVQNIIYTSLKLYMLLKWDNYETSPLTD